MKVMKLALLGTAALAAVSVSARADDLASLKAEMEALKAEVAALKAEPSVPAGYQLLTITKADLIQRPGFDGEVRKATTLSIVPTADMPASTVVQFAGEVKAGYVWHNEATGDEGTEIQANAELVVTGMTDTAVGEVGAWIKFEAAADGHTGVYSSTGNITEAWGWWKMTPELALGAGFDDDVSGIGHGSDLATAKYVGGFGATGQVADDSSQMRLSYTSGPIAAAVSVGSHDDGLGPDDDSYIVSGEVKYSGDSFSAEVAGAFGEEEGDDVWQIGAGVTFVMDVVTLSASAGMGEDDDGDDYTEASIFAKANLSDSIRAELGAGMTTEDGEPDETGVYGGLYYSPVSQLTIGVEAAWTDVDGAPDAEVEAALVTSFKF